MSSQERAVAGEDEQFHWVLQHHTPRTFNKERPRRDQTSLRMYDPGRLPVFWTPSPSPSRPVSPRQPVDEPLPAPTMTNPPRRLKRIRQPVFGPDNVYRNRPPAHILRQPDTDDVFSPPRNQSPGPSRSPSGNDPSASASKAKMLQDGGAKLINFLLRAAVSLTDAKGIIPDVSKVREWQYRDLMCLPKAVQEGWRTACKEELEALHRHNVFKLTNLPKGRKSIGCRWVFDIKSDGHKKARLVAQGFSQVEGIDFNELFSPVVHFESV